MEWYQWCRLCGNEDGNHIINENFNNTVSTVYKLLSIEIKEDIKIPKSICSFCYKVLKFLEKFLEKIRRMDKMFLEINAKYKSGNSINAKMIRANYNFKNLEHNNDSDIKPIIDKLEYGTKINNIENLLTYTSFKSISNNFTNTVSENKNLCNENFNYSKSDVNDLEQLKSSDIITFQKENKMISPDVEIETFECKEGNLNLTGESNYTYHLKNFHNLVDKTIANNISCNICEKICRTKQNLKYHMELHLPPEEREKLLYKCPECDQKFTQKGTMRSHIRARHSLEKPFICEQCGKKFSSQRNLWAHKRSHDDGNHLICSKCPKIFKNKFRLKVHMQGHNDSSHRCSKCGLILKTINTLKNHMLVHSDIKAYECKYCNKKFKRDKNLQMHLITHSGLRPFICRFCSQGYANRSNCKKHEKHSHKQEYEAAAALFSLEPEPKIGKKLPNIQQLEEMLKQMKSDKENKNT